MTLIKSVKLDQLTSRLSLMDVSRYIKEVISVFYSSQYLAGKKAVYCRLGIIYYLEISDYEF